MNHQRTATPPPEAGDGIALGLAVVLFLVTVAAVIGVFAGPVSDRFDVVRTPDGPAVIEQAGP